MRTGLVYPKKPALYCTENGFMLVSVVDDLQLPPHRVELGHKLGFNFCRIGVGGNAIEIDLCNHAVEKVADLLRVSRATRQIGTIVRTGLACHLPPPNSNHERCPPSEVVRSTVYGFCVNSWKGIAS